MQIDINENLYPRERYLKEIRGFYDQTELIKVITGVRRCGKSSIMNLIIKELLSNGVRQDNILYFHLDKRPYKHIKTADQLDELIEKNAITKEIKYLFIDEIQNIEGFEEVINGWREEGDFSIFITGSNSYLLSGELVTKLTGRYIEFSIMPLTFDEYLKMKEFLGITVSSNDQDELRNYIYEGGFPFALKLSTMNEKRIYAQNLISEIFEKDIRKRCIVKNKAVFDIVMKYVINNFGSTMSLKNIVEDFKKHGINIKRETIDKYIKALISAKIIMQCDRFDVKSRKSIAGEKKYYLTDLSFFYALNTDNRINYGPALENILFTYAKSQNYMISVGRIGKLECDFILRDNEMNYSYVQVAYTILESRETEDREYKPLEQIIWDNYPRYVMTTDFLLQKRKGIKHENILEFMKDEKRF